MSFMNSEFSLSVFRRRWLPGTTQRTLSSYIGTFHCVYRGPFSIRSAANASIGAMSTG